MRAAHRSDNFLEAFLTVGFVVVLLLALLEGCSGVLWPKLIEVRIVGDGRDAGADAATVDAGDGG